MVALLFAALAALPPLDTMAKARLHSGRILVETREDGAEKGSVRALGWANCPPEKVWSVITDHSSFPEFMPHLKAVKVSQRSEKGERVFEEVDAVVSMARYTLDFAFDKEAQRVDFALDKSVKNDIAEARGHWQLWPFQRGTLIEYVSAVDLGRSIPGFIRSYLAERGTEDAVDAIRRRAEGSTPH